MKFSFKTLQRAVAEGKFCPHLLSSPTKSVGEEEDNPLAHGFQREGTTYIPSPSGRGLG